MPDTNQLTGIRVVSDSGFSAVSNAHASGTNQITASTAATALIASPP